MGVVLFCVALFWVSFGTWLTVDCMDGAMSRIRQQYGRVIWPALFFAFAVTVLFSPALFIWGLFKGRPNA